MKRVLSIFAFLFISVNMWAGSLSIVEGSGDFLKTEGVVKVIFNWAEAKYAGEKSLIEEWNKDKLEYDTYVAKGQQALLEGFNGKSKKLTATCEGATSDYTMEINVENIDYFFSAMSIVPGHKFTIWTEITVKDKSGKVVCKLLAKRFKGGRDLVRTDAYTKMMYKLGEELAKI